MKKYFALGVAAAVVGALFAHGVPRGKAEATIAGKKVSVEYGRPGLNGRDMLGRAGVGTVWRMGSDRATTLSAEGDLLFGDIRIPGGTYSLHARKITEDGWELIFHSDTRGRRDESKDVASVPLKTNSLDSSVETFTIDVGGGSGRSGRFSMAWGEQRLTANFTVE